MSKGIVKFFNVTKGFGFIKDDESQNERPGNFRITRRKKRSYCCKRKTSLNKASFEQKKRGNLPVPSFFFEFF
jgi:hypothetical protein